MAFASWGPDVRKLRERSEWELMEDAALRARRDARGEELGVLTWKPRGGEVRELRVYRGRERVNQFGFEDKDGMDFRAMSVESMRRLGVRL
jgi:hypothetical protein